MIIVRMEMIWTSAHQLVIRGKQEAQLAFSFTQVSEKKRSSFNSRKVRKQNRVCSNGSTFLIATCRPDGLCKAATTVP